MSILKNKNIIFKKNRRFLMVGILALFFSGFVFSGVSAQNSDNMVKLDVFYGQGCPHCASLRSFLTEIKKKYPTLEVQEHEVYNHDEERELFGKVAKKFKTKIEGVPTVFIGEKVITGFGGEISKNLENEIKKCLTEKCPDPLENLDEESAKNANNFLENSEAIKNSEVFLKNNAKDNVKKMTISVVIGAAAVDAINPCAFAVLIILMTTALSIADKKRALKFGLAFTLSIYLAYFLMGLGLFSALKTTNFSNGFYIFVTVLAVFVGLMNIKDYFWYGKGFLMEVPLSWRPKMKKIIGSATSPLGAFLIGFVVSLFELPCTGGPYIVILGLLAKEMTRWSGIGYLLIYNLIFVAPLLALSFIIYKGLSTTKKLEEIRQEKLKILHLIAGLIMLLIAGLMIASIINNWV